MRHIKIYTILALMFLLGIIIFTSSTVDDKKKRDNNPLELVRTNIDGKGTNLTLVFKPGESHNYPTMAVWVEDVNGNYIQTLFVTQSVATGIFGHGEEEATRWKQEPGPVRRPATLPYYLHKRNIKAPDGTYLPTPESPIPDAYTGATPKSAFKLETQTDTPLKGKFVLLFEVNQSWDWNEFWNNRLYPDNFDYKTSCQPAVVYAVSIDLDNKMDSYRLNPIGHSHFSGANGKLYTDLSTITTALNIFKSIEVDLN